ncbi:MAG: hypothetical protein ACU0BS_07350 [Hasllibacter sp.]
MRLTITLALCAALAGCGFAARLNPLNWFERSAEAPRTLLPDGAELIAENRGYVDQITGLTIEPMPGGAIVRAIGLPPVQGRWDAELTEEGIAGGVLTYAFRVRAAPTPQPVGTAPSREVVVAAFVPDERLRRVRVIRVEAARNARELRR